MATTKSTPAPKGLGTHGKALWRRILKDYQLSTSEAVVLEAMCGQLDRFREAQALVAAEGLTVEGRFGSRPHPALVVERHAASELRLLAKQLDLRLPDDAPVKLTRPGPTGEARRRRNEALGKRRKERRAREVAG